MPAGELSRLPEAHPAVLTALAHAQGAAMAMPDADTESILLLDTHGTVIGANTAAAAALGCTVEALIGTSAFERFPPDVAAVRRFYFERVLGSGEAIRLEDERSGHLLDHHILPVLGARGQCTGVAICSLDLTRRRHAEEELRAAKRAAEQARESAEAANRAKDHFLAVLSHELRTPLTPVLATAQRIENDPTLSEQHREAIKLIRRNVAVETRLIDDLLDLNRLARGKISLYREPIDLHELLGHVVRICQTDLQHKELKLVLDLRASHMIVHADPARLEQVLWNLLRNAIKFTPLGGRITIVTRNVEGEQIAVEITDTGVGIDPKTLPRVFHAFEQGGQDVTRQFGGLGLGLAISRSLVELHGGTVKAHSEGKGKGASFTVSLPTLALAAAEHAATRHPSATIPRGLRVLLVEDHEDTARAMASLLRALGLEVQVAYSVAEGLRMAEATAFDLLLSDIGLPDGSGLGLMRQVAAIRPTRAIALSGFGMEEDIRQSLAAGFVAHLTKPVDITILDHVLAEVLARPAPPAARLLSERAG